MDDLKNVELDEGKSVSTSAVNYQDKRVNIRNIYFTLENEEINVGLTNTHLSTARSSFKMTWKDPQTELEWNYRYSLKLETTCGAEKRKRSDSEMGGANSLYYAATRAKRVVSHVYYHVEGNSKLQINAQLSYVGQDVTRIPMVLCKLYGSRVSTLDLSFNSLTSLTHLEYFPHLSELILDNNHLGDYMVFPHLPHLHTLSLNKNNISDLEHLLAKIEANFPNLRYLSLLGNAACPHQMTDSEKDEEDYQRYRYFVLYNLPQLQFLDSRKVKPDERQEALRRGQYCKVAKPSLAATTEATLATLPTRRTEDRHSYAPLPLHTKTSSDHHGMYGKNRMRYAGNHSEGNRFIRNNDL